MRVTVHLETIQNATARPLKRRSGTRLHYCMIVLVPSLIGFVVIVKMNLCQKMFHRLFAMMNRKMKYHRLYWMNVMKNCVSQRKRPHHRRAGNMTMTKGGWPNCVKNRNRNRDQFHNGASKICRPRCRIRKIESMNLYRILPSR